MVEKVLVKILIEEDELNDKNLFQMLLACNFKNGGTYQQGWRFVSYR